MINFPKQWSNLLKDEFQKPYFQKLGQKLLAEYNTSIVYPKEENIFRAYELCKPEDVRVVIIGQDPYPNEHAHGLSFSTLEQRRPVSLRYIFKEICENYTGYDYKTDFISNDLTNWAQQGVFLLNAVLTVRAGESNSHKGIGWETFTGATINKLWFSNSPKVFILWGKSALNLFNKAVPNEGAGDYHLILTCGHPATAAYGNDLFTGNKHFQQTNMFLISHGLEPITWKVLTPSSMQTA
jgi:uracil-DNA glycosylase